MATYPGVTYLQYEEPKNPQAGDTWYPGDGYVRYYDGSGWKMLSSGSGSGSGNCIGSLPCGDTGVFGGGYDGSSYVNTIDYITISTPSNATDFGDLTVARGWLAATSNA